MPVSSGRVQAEPGHQNESGCGDREDQVSKRREREQGRKERRERKTYSCIGQRTLRYSKAGGRSSGVAGRAGGDV